MEDTQFIPDEHMSSRERLSMVVRSALTPDSLVALFSKEHAQKVSDIIKQREELTELQAYLDSWNAGKLARNGLLFVGTLQAGPEASLLALINLIWSDTVRKFIVKNKTKVESITQ